MSFTRLRAKSGTGEYPSEFLPEHLADAFRSAQLVLGATAGEQLSALGLAGDSYRERLCRIVSVAAAVHDLGKANDHFQGMLSGSRNVQVNPQGLRHEWVGLIMLERLREWLLPALHGSSVDFAVMEWAVVGHHPAVTHESPPRSSLPGAGAEIVLLMGHDDYRESLARIRSLLELGPLPECVNISRTLVIGSGSVFDEIARWNRAAQATWATMRSFADRRLVAAVKNCLVAADVAGSALPKAMPDDPKRWNWITESFAAKPQPGDLTAIARYRLRGHEPRRFQQAVAAAEGPIVYVKAGCGTGKTVAAYLRSGSKNPTRRLYFCYPTTGTATEGFRDYLYAPETDAPSDEDQPLARRIRGSAPSCSTAVATLTLRSFFRLGTNFANPSRIPRPGWTRSRPGQRRLWHALWIRSWESFRTTSAVCTLGRLWRKRRSCSTKYTPTTTGCSVHCCGSCGTCPVFPRCS